MGVVIPTQVPSYCYTGACTEMLDPSWGWYLNLKTSGVLTFDNDLEVDVLFVYADKTEIFKSINVVKENNYEMIIGAVGGKCLVLDHESSVIEDSISVLIRNAEINTYSTPFNGKSVYGFSYNGITPAHMTFNSKTLF